MRWFDKSFFIAYVSSYYSLNYHKWPFRLQLTVMHHNENCNRSLMTKKDGTLRKRIGRSKATQLKPVLSYVRAPATHGKWIQLNQKYTPIQFFKILNFWIKFQILAYIEVLLDKLGHYLETETQPTIKDPVLDTLASKGPKYVATDDLEHGACKQTRGLKVKPHFLKRSSPVPKKRRLKKW